MTDTNAEAPAVNISVSGVLQKFDGEGTEPQNLVERIYIEQNEIVKVEFFENGEKTGEEIVEEGGTN